MNLEQTLREGEKAIKLPSFRVVIIAESHESVAFAQFFPRYEIIPAF